MFILCCRLVGLLSYVHSILHCLTCGDHWTLKRRCGRSSDTAATLNSFQLRVRMILCAGDGLVLVARLRLATSNFVCSTPAPIIFSDFFAIAAQALAVTSQSLTINQTSGHSHESLSASGLRTPPTGRPGSVNDPVSSGKMSAMSPTSLHTPQTLSNVEETLMVASDGAHEENMVQMKAEVCGFSSSSPWCYLVLTTGSTCDDNSVAHSTC